MYSLLFHLIFFKGLRKLPILPFARSSPFPAANENYRIRSIITRISLYIILFTYMIRFAIFMQTIRRYILLFAGSILDLWPKKRCHPVVLHAFTTPHNTHTHTPSVTAAAHQWNNEMLERWTQLCRYIILFHTHVGNMRACVYCVLLLLLIK